MSLVFPLVTIPKLEKPRSKVDRPCDIVEPWLLWWEQCEEYVVRILWVHELVVSRTKQCTNTPTHLVASFLHQKTVRLLSYSCAINFRSKRDSTTPHGNILHSLFTAPHINKTQTNKHYTGTAHAALVTPPTRMDTHTHKRTPRLKHRNYTTARKHKGTNTHKNSQKQSVSPRQNNELNKHKKGSIFALQGLNALANLGFKDDFQLIIGILLSPTFPGAIGMWFTTEGKSWHMSNGNKTLERHSIESWLVNRDPYIGLWNNPHIVG